MRNTITMKNIMKRAWEIYRTLEGDRLAKLAMALKQAWAEAKAENGREDMLLEIAGWFTDKKARENGLPFYGGYVMAVLNETEKAYKVFWGDILKPMFFWVPKSLCKWVKGSADKRTFVGEEAFEHAKNELSFLRSAC